VGCGGQVGGGVGGGDSVPTVINGVRVRRYTSQGGYGLSLLMSDLMEDEGKGGGLARPCL